MQINLGKTQQHIILVVSPQVGCPFSVSKPQKEERKKRLKNYERPLMVLGAAAVCIILYSASGMVVSSRKVAHRFGSND